MQFSLEYSIVATLLPPFFLSSFACLSVENIDKLNTLKLSPLFLSSFIYLRQFTLFSGCAADVGDRMPCL